MDAYKRNRTEREGAYENCDTEIWRDIGCGVEKPGNGSPENHQCPEKRISVRGGCFCHGQKGRSLCNRYPD